MCRLASSQIGLYCRVWLYEQDIRRDGDMQHDVEDPAYKEFMFRHEPYDWMIEMSP